MKLLHPEVDVTPGRAGKRPQSAPYQDREKLDGSVVLRLTNDTTQENAYTVRLRCENPFWQEAWYTVQSLPAAPGAPATAVKPDVPGHQGRSVKVFVPRGAAARHPDPLQRPRPPRVPRRAATTTSIEVETQVSAPQAGDGAARRKDRRHQPARRRQRPPLLQVGPGPDAGPEAGGAAPPARRVRRGRHQRGQRLAVLRPAAARAPRTCCWTARRCGWRCRRRSRGSFCRARARRRGVPARSGRCRWWRRRG